MEIINFIHHKSDSYGDDLRTFREYSGLTQMELAARLDVHIQAVWFWENYKHRPRRKTFRKINEFLKKWHEENEVADEVD